MNFLLYRQNEPKFIKNIPDGLNELMSDISREVLRSQENISDIYGFICNYLESLIATRDKIAVVRHIIDDVIDVNSFVRASLSESGISSDKVNEAAPIVQHNLRSFITKREINNHCESLNESDILEELINKCNFTKNDILKSRPTIRNAFKQFVIEYTRILKNALYRDEAIETNVKKTLNNYLTREPDIKKLNESAVKIQALFRGYHVRKTLKLKEKLLHSRKALLFRYTHSAKVIQRAFREYLSRKSFSKSFEEEGYFKQAHEESSIINIEKTNPEVHKATTLIQAAFKGYLVRKYLANQKLSTLNQDGKFRIENLSNGSDKITDLKVFEDNGTEQETDSTENKDEKSLNEEFDNVTKKEKSDEVDFFVEDNDEDCGVEYFY